MSFTPVAGENVDIVLELPSGESMGFLTRGATALRRMRASDYAPIVAEAGIETEATGSWRRWAEREWGGIGEEDWEAGNMLAYAESVAIQKEFITLDGTWTQWSTNGDLHHFVEFGGDIYCLKDDHVYKWDYAGESWSDANTLGANGTDLLVNDDKLYALCGDATNGEYSSDGSSWSDMGVAGTVMVWWLEHAWRAKGNTLYSSETPDQSGTWSSGQGIGNAAWGITALAPYDNKLFIGKEEALFYYDGANVVEVKDCRSRVYSDNFKGMASWAGYLFFGIKGSIIRYHPDSELDITPRKIGDKDDEFYGFGFPKWFLPGMTGIFVLFDDAGGDTPYVLKYTGVGWFVSYVGDSGDTAMVGGLGWSAEKNWLIVGQEGDNTYYQQRRSLTDAPYDDYQASGHIITPWWDGGFPEENMEVRLCTIEGEDFDSTEKATVYYQAGDDDSWTALGDFTASPQSQRSFAPLEGAISCKKLRLKIELHRDAGDSSLTPRLTGWSVQFKNRPRAVYVFTPEIKLGANLQRKDRSGLLPYTLAEQLAFLDECASASQPLIYTTALGSMMVDLTNSRRGAGRELKGGRYEPTVALNLIQAYAGDWITLEETQQISASISFEEQTKLTVYWARDNNADPGFDKSERYWGQFVYEPDS